MSYYTEKIKGTIVFYLELGDNTIREIASLCNVSIYFVRKVINEYDWFYAR